ncbi:hypothetical protein AB6A40_009452 [Gnathostoma spinigerum]|uniref:Sphingomyelin phosphodiesterase n=1 Tax=Gnathostoma spinigerum TaxID=75299 RepID=A0ABD6ESF3_9BILA
MDRLILLILYTSLFVIVSTKETDSIECMGCKAVVIAFRQIHGSNATQDAIISLATFICDHFVQRESIVCYGMARQFREEILYVLSKLITEPSQMCGLFISGCGSSQFPFSDWKVAIPDLPKTLNYPLYPNPKNATFRVLQISDIHFDMLYKPGSVANCHQPLCCQEQSTLNGSHKIEAGYWGTLGACDVPYWTVISMMEHINKTQKVDYILIGGDFMSHLDWSYTRAGHLAVIKNLTALLALYFPDVPVYWTLGNHEGVPINSFAPHYIPSRFRPQWVYRAIAEAQKEWMDKKQIKNMHYRGSYTAQLFDGLLLISLNTGYCETTNFWLYLNQTDPDTTLSWLVKQLYAAEMNEQYVHILAHIPPGNGECLEGWARNYYRIVNRFNRTIVAQFFAHIHIDSFSLFYEDMNSDASNPTSVLYASPSVTTFIGLNPSFRIYDVDAGNRYNVIDFETHFFNLSSSQQSVQPQWQLLYRAKAEYGLQDLSPSSWANLADEITYFPQRFNQFLKNSVRRDDYVCDKNCRYGLLCSLRSAHHNDSLCSHIGQRGFAHGFIFNRFSSRQQTYVEKTSKKSSDYFRYSVLSPSSVKKWMRGLKTETKLALSLLLPSLVSGGF